MGETNHVDATPSKSKFKTLKSEFKKIVWPDKQSLAKQSLAVVVISIILCIIIAVVDFVFQTGISALLK